MRIVLEPTPKATEQAGEKAPSLPRGFDEWLERCLHKNADKRWSSAQEAINRLTTLLDEGYEDEATTQMDTSRANALVHALLSPKPTASVKEVAPKNTGTLPLVSVPDKPDASIAAGPRGTAVMEIRRDASGRPTALSRPGTLDENEERAPAGPGMLGTASIFDTHYEAEERVPEPRAIPIVKRAAVKSRPQPTPAATPALVVPSDKPYIAPEPPFKRGTIELRPVAPTSKPDIAHDAAHPAVAHKPAVAFPAAGLKQKRSRFTTVNVIAVLSLLLGLAVVIALLVSRKGSLNVVVVSAHGTALPKLEVFIDGRIRCTTSPCVVKDLSPGSRSIRVAVDGAPAAVPIDAVVESGTEKTVTIMVGLPGAH
jgi:hypothetical protein